jgi:hypothetical protein
MTAQELPFAEFFEGLTVFHFIGHLSYMLAAAGFLFRDILLLRILAVCASSANITFSFFGAVEPNFIAIFWQSVFICINLTWSIRLIVERRGVNFSEEERELYQTIFRTFAPVEFMKLMRICSWQTTKEGDLLTEAGKDVDDVILIYNGEVGVDLPGGGSRRLKDGSFVGEMSFIRGGGATATVSTLCPTRVVRWPRPALKALLARNPAMRSTLQTVFSEDLTNKLLEADPI